MSKTWLYHLAMTLGKILNLSTSVSCFVKWAFLGIGGSRVMDSYLRIVGTEYRERI